MDKKNENTFTINLIGIGCTIYIISLTHEINKKMQQTAILLNMTLEDAILDSDFFTKMNDNIFKDLNSISKIKMKGLLYDNRSHIEIRLNGRKKRKIQFSELLKQELLFPIYNVVMQLNTLLINNTLIVIEKETGLISNFKLLVETLDLDKMQFEITEINTGTETLTILKSISYNEKMLMSIKEDTLVTSNYSIKK